MDHDLELIIARLEILEIGVCNIIYNPGNIGKRTFCMFWYPGNNGNLIFPISGYPVNIGNIFFPDFWDFYKEDARRNFTQNGPVFAARSLI